jgi:hypothetical protein
MTDATQDVDFANQRYYNAEPDTDITIFRPCPKYPSTLAGHLVRVAEHTLAVTDRGLSIEEGRTLRNVNLNGNPRDLRDLVRGGDKAALYSIADDMPAIAMAGLLGASPAGRVVHVDNSAGQSSAFVLFPGTPPAAVNSCASAFVRGSGAVGIGLGNEAEIPVPQTTITDGYKVVTSADQCSFGNKSLVISVAPTSNAYIALPRLEDGGPMLLRASLSTPMINNKSGHNFYRAPDLVNQNIRRGSIGSAVLSCEAAPFLGSHQTFLAIDDGTRSNCISVFRDGDGELVFQSVVSGETAAAINIGSLANGERFSVGVTWNDGAYIVSRDGLPACARHAAANRPLSVARFGRSIDGGYCNGYLKRVAFFDKHLDAMALQKLSSGVDFERPFSKLASPWNVCPKNPVLARQPVTTAASVGIEAGRFASAVFAADAAGSAIEIFGPDEDKGPFINDEKRRRVITIPNFPKDVQVAGGDGYSRDGHLEVVDQSSRLIHSFYKMQFSSDRRRWEAQNYAVTSLDGHGFGTPSKPYSSRAAGCPAFGGVLRAHEYGKSILEHALAIIPSKDDLKSGPVDPATLEDANGASFYRGAIPMGSLLMLPDTFNAEALANTETQCIARTLKKYGGRIVDTTSSPYFLFMAEFGSRWNQSSKPNWYSDLKSIRNELRLVVGQGGWQGQMSVPASLVPLENQNLISMRGTWSRYAGERACGSFDTIKNGFVFADGEGDVTMSIMRYRTYASPAGQEQSQQPWWRWLYGDFWYMNPEAGVTYIIAAYGIGEDISASLAFVNSQYQIIAGTPPLSPGKSAKLTVPSEWANGSANARQFVSRKGKSREAVIRLEMTRAD